MNSNISRLKELFYGVELDFNDQVFIYQSESMLNFKLHEVYKISDGGPPIIKQFGSRSYGDISQDIRDLISEARNHKRLDFEVSNLNKMQLLCSIHSIMEILGSCSNSYIIGVLDAIYHS